MSLPKTTQVLVVGAGPAGLVCAFTLRQLGLQVVIVDASFAGGQNSRAPLVHARTLEILDKVGLAQPLWKSGVHGKKIIYYGGVNKLLEVDMTLLQGHTKFPGVLILPQYQTEQILEDQLAAAGVTVLRNHRAVGMKEAQKGQGIKVSFEDGSIISARYVVGADGPRSTIRRLAGVDFHNPLTSLGYDSDQASSSTMRLLLADVRFEEPMPPSIPLDAAFWHLNDQVMLCPILRPQGKGPGTKPQLFWRIAFVIPTGSPPPPRHPDIELIQQYMDKRNPYASRMKIISAEHTGTYRVRSAVATTFFKNFGAGDVLLVGDAAHVHSPAGAQGMNLGMCDAVALGHAIREHVDAKAAGEKWNNADLPFIKYSTSRRDSAIAVIKMTNKITSVINAEPGWRRKMWNIALWLVGRFTVTRRLAAWRLSGLIHRE